MKYCKKCLMPDTRPGISFNEEGVCSACQNYEIEKALYYYDRILNLPCSSNLTEKEVYQVIEKIKEFKK